MKEESRMRGQNSTVSPYQFNRQPFERSIYINPAGREVSAPRPPRVITSRHVKKHFQLPPPQVLHQQSLSISKVQPKKEEWSIFNIFECCEQPLAIQQPEFQDCQVCNRRVFRKPHQEAEETEGQPYMSKTRLKSRQTKPVSTFYNQLRKEEFENEEWYFN